MHSRLPYQQLFRNKLLTYWYRAGHNVLRHIASLSAQVLHLQTHLHGHKFPVPFPTRMRILRRSGLPLHYNHRPEICGERIRLFVSHFLYYLMHIHIQQELPTNYRDALIYRVYICQTIR